MKNLSVFKAFGDGFKGLIKNLVFLLILLGVHLGLTYGIGYILNSFFPEVSTGNYALLETNYRLGFSSVILNIALALIVFVYRTYLTLLVLTIFFNTHLDMEMTISQMFLYSFNRIATVLRVILIFLPIVIILVFTTSQLLFHIGFYMIYLLYFVFLVGIFFMSFVQHGIVVNEFGAFKTIANSFSFVKKHFLKVLLFSILGIGSQFLFNYLSVQFVVNVMLDVRPLFSFAFIFKVIEIITLILLVFYLSSSMALYCQTVEVVEEDEEDEMDLQAIY